MNHAFRVATELVYATIAYHEARMARLNDPSKERARQEDMAYSYLCRVQNELNEQCVILACKEEETV